MLNVQLLITPLTGIVAGSGLPGAWLFRKA